MDVISQGPERDPRFPPVLRRWLAAAAITGLVAGAAVVALTRGAAGPGAPAATAVPGTALLTCDSAVSRVLPGDWRAGSLQVGPLWLVGGRKLGYVHLGHSKDVGRAPQTQPALHIQLQLGILVHVDAGSAVVMRAAAGTRPYFQFLDGSGVGSPLQPIAADQGFTLVPCPGGSAGAGRATDFYQLGFSVPAGRTASVEVWTSPSARPTWLTFTAPTTPPRVPPTTSITLGSPN